MIKCHSIWTCCAIAACGIAAVVSPSQAATVNVATDDGSGADAYIRGGTLVDVNNGGATAAVLSRSGNNDFDRIPYLRFDLSSASVTPSQITDATLNLFNSFSSNTGTHTYHFYGLNDNQNADNWEEGADNGLDVLADGDGTNDNWLRASNAPGISTASTVTFDFTALTDLGTLLVDHDPFVGNDAFSFSSAALTTFLTTDTDGLVTIIMNHDGGGSGSPAVQTKENSTSLAANLDLTVPEPSAALLMALSAWGLMATRRRRK